MDASKRPKASKSRIPVSTNYQKSLNVNQDRNAKIVSKVQSSNSKTTNPRLLPTVPLKESRSQPLKTDKSLSDRLKKNSKLKENVQPSLKSNIKAISHKGRDELIKTKANLDDKKGKDQLSSKNNDKSSNKREKLSTLIVPNNCSTKEKSNLDGKKGKDQLSSKNNNKSYNKEEKLSTLIVPNNCSTREKFATPKALLKENKISPKMSCFSSQKDIKFEANEDFRKMILRGRELSPSVCNIMPGFRLSLIQSQRPSAYQKFEVSANPFKEAMQAIERASLSVKRDQKSVQKPKCQAISSPFKKDTTKFLRDSLYTPCQDPKLEVMKSLEKVRLQQLQKNALKSTKKVTFDLNIKEYTPKDPCDMEIKSFKNSENRLTQINEKSEENTPNSPQNERIPSSTAKPNKENSPTSGLKKNKNSFIHSEINITSEADDVKKYKCDTNYESSTFCTLTNKKNSTILPKDTNPGKLSSIQYDKHLNSNFVNHIQILGEISPKYKKTFEERILNAENIQIDRAKVYTPRPISFHSKYNLTNSSSPEFLEKGASETLLKLAPICTPLVLKNMSKSHVLSPDLTPVRLKLDFSEKNSPIKQTPQNHKQHATLQNIVTSKDILDALADEECCSFLINDNISVVCGRYLADPVASILTEGDEMHFIPIPI